MALTNSNKKSSIKQKIRLVEGQFTASEALDVISSLINTKINFHKLQRLQETEGNHKADTPELNGRIDELEKEKEITREFIEEVRELGKNIIIYGTLEITVAP